MLKRVLSLLFGFPLAVALVAIAVANRQYVPLVLNPFDPSDAGLTLSLPLYAFLLGALTLGVVLGGVATWFGQSRWRRTARAQGQRASRFEAEAERLARERDKSISDARALTVAGE